MKTSLDHLPERKQRELAHVVETLREGFAQVIGRKRSERAKSRQILKIILFGSYARGDWVEDPVGRYFSDYDILVVVNSERATDGADYWARTEQKLLADLAEGTRLRTPVSTIYHTLDEVNEQLRLGRYFFMDIVRDGNVLFEEPGHPLAEPQPLSPEQALKETREYYQQWFESAVAFLKGAGYFQEIGRPKEAAFNLHQATERLYHCVFLVRTLYSLKSHNLNRLRSQVEQLESCIAVVWPNSTKFERRCYELIRQAYINARYSKHYRITPEELAWLGQRIGLLRDLIREICDARVTELAQTA